MLDKLVTELAAIGLSDKEARVYLAGLELGGSTAQKISAKAIVNRPTTYVALESLTKRGLMGTVTQGVKRLFVSEPPENILGMLREQKRVIEDQENRVAGIMDDLNVLTAGQKDRPTVLSFEGTSGIEQMLEDIRKSPDREIEEFSALDLPGGPLPPAFAVLLGGFREGKASRIIYTSHQGTVLPEREKNVERRPIPVGEYPFEGNVIICGSTVSLISWQPKPIGVQMGNPGLTVALRQMFRLAWGRLEK